MKGGKSCLITMLIFVNFTVAIRINNSHQYDVLEREHPISLA